VKEETVKTNVVLLDDRMLQTPSIALQATISEVAHMGEIVKDTMEIAKRVLLTRSREDIEALKDDENEVDMYEDQIGTYLVKLSSASMSEKDSHEVTKILHIIGDFERISDHSVGFAKSAKEIAEKKISFSQQADDELSKLMAAMDEVLELTLASYENEDVSKAVLVEPLEQVIDYLKAFIKRQHIERLQRNECTIELGFILTDIVTTLGRVSDHCSNIAGCLIEISNDRYDLHEYFQGVKSSGDEFERNYNHFMLKYGVR
jgi:phosphate:Na+ symporter